MRDSFRRIVVVGVLAAAGFAMYLAFTRGKTDQTPIRRGPVTRVFPQSDAVALRQDAVGADLASGYTAELAIDSHAIPLDQLDRVAAGEGTRISFTPGKGKEYERLDAGRHCATLSYTTTVTTVTTAAGGSGPTSSTVAGSSAPSGASTYTWCFIAS